MDNTAYDTLLQNIKSQFLYTYRDTAYTIGEYMTEKSQDEKNASRIPAIVLDEKLHPVSAAVSHLMERMTVTEMPPAEKTICLFPKRTCAVAFFVTLSLCAMLFSYTLRHISLSSRADTAYVAAAFIDEMPEYEVMLTEGNTNV